MSNEQADYLENVLGKSTIESKELGMFYVTGKNLMNKQKCIGIAAHTEDGKHDKVVYLTTRQLIALRDELPDLIETYC